MCNTVIGLQVSPLDRYLTAFCSDLLACVTRSSLLNHMAREHSFSIGLPDNIVYCKQFLETLQSKLDEWVHPGPDRPRRFSGCCSQVGMFGAHFSVLCQSSVSVLRENLPR